MSKTDEQGCRNPKCRHPRSEHNEIDGYCDVGILTVLDTTGNCPCEGYLSPAYDGQCVPCGHPASGHKYDDFMRGDVCAVCGPFGCMGLVTQADIDKADREYKPCSRCGDDPNYCVCTTGWSPTGGMVW